MGLGFRAWIWKQKVPKSGLEIQEDRYNTTTQAHVTYVSCLICKIHSKV